MNNILKTYLTKFIGIGFNIFSFFLVVPYLSSNKEIFGIYSSILFFLIFISYIDFGFISAAIKFASEAHGSNENKEEIKIISFSSFITFLMTLVISIFFLFLYYNPTFLFEELNIYNAEIAKKLYLGLAIFAPVYSFKRCLQVIYQVRLKDYLFLAYDIIFSGLKILLIFFFFSEGNYQIIEYFYSYNVILLILNLIMMVNLILKFNYDWIDFFKNFRWSHKLFNKTKEFAFTMFLSSFGFIIITQLDVFAIPFLFSANEVAVYSIALTLLTYLRTIISSIYHPFVALFNQIIGRKENNNLTELRDMLLMSLFPLVFLIVFIPFIYADEIIHLWVGQDYLRATIYFKFLVFSFLLFGISFPIIEYFKAIQQNKALKQTSKISVLFYVFILMILHLNLKDLIAFPLARFFTEILSFSIILYYFKKKYNKFSFSIFFGYSSIITIIIVLFSKYLFLNSFTIDNIIKLIFYLSFIFFICISVLFTMNKKSYFILYNKIKGLL